MLGEFGKEGYCKRELLVSEGKGRGDAADWFSCCPGQLVLVLS